MADKKQKKKQRRIGRPNGVLLWLMMLFIVPWYRLCYGVRIDRRALKGMKGPALILAPHICARDHFLVLMTLWRWCPNFVASAHLMAQPRLGRFLRLMHVIPKRMFCTDIRAIRDILRAKDEGNVIVLFPEGRLPACGHSLPVTAGTAELVKRMGISVYTVTSNGGYLTFPKWGAPRRGEIKITTACLFTATALAEMSLAEVREKINAAIQHNDECAMAGVRYRTSDTTRGIDGLLRRCPVCGRVGGLTAAKGHIRCECGMDTVLDETWHLRGVRFTRVNEWFDWQTHEIDPATDRLEDDVVIGTTDERGIMVSNAGRGHICLDRDAFTYHGTVMGEEVALTVPTSEIAGIPVTPAHHFDMFIAGRMYHFAPIRDRRAVMDYVMYIDRFRETENR